MFIRPREELIQEYIDSKIKNKELFLPEYIIPKINAFIELVLAMRNKIYKTRQCDDSLFKNTFPDNCALYYTAFYYKIKKLKEKEQKKKKPKDEEERARSEQNRFVYSNENRLRKIVGDNKTVPSVKYLLTNFYNVATDENSNSEIVKLRRENTKKKRSLWKNHIYYLLALHLWDLIPPKRRKNLTRDEVYDIVVNAIEAKEEVFVKFLNFLSADHCIKIQKPFGKGGGRNWNSNRYQIYDKIFNKKHISLYEAGELTDNIMERLDRIYRNDAMMYGIGDEVCYWDYKTTNSLSYDIDYKRILNQLLPELEPIKNKKTKEIITPEMQIEKYEKDFKQIVESIPNCNKYSRQNTLDRHYNPYQRIKSVLRKAINERNEYVEVDYTSAQLNVLIALAVDDISDDTLKNNLFPSTYRAIREAKKEARIDDKYKNELRKYYGDFYSKLLDYNPDIPYNRSELKSDMVTFLNVASNKMKHFEVLMKALNSTKALTRFRYFIERIKFYNNIEAYRVLFKIESILIRETILKCISKNIPTICIHDAICCPKEYAETVKGIMDKVAKKQNVLTSAEIESNNKVAITNETEDKLINSRLYNN